MHLLHEAKKNTKHTHNPPKVSEALARTHTKKHGGFSCDWIIESVDVLMNMRMSMY